MYLDGEQLFFQLIMRKDRPEVPENIAAFYRKFLGPVIETSREFSVRPRNTSPSTTSSPTGARYPARARLRLTT